MNHSHAIQAVIFDLDGVLVDSEPAHHAATQRLIAPGTVEEKIWELQQSKAKTIADVLGEEGFARSLTATDLEYLFAEE